MQNSQNLQNSAQIQELIKFCTQPSVADQNRGMAEMVALVESKLKSLGADVKQVKVGDSYPFLLAELKGSKNNKNSKSTKNKKTLLIYNHYDVQPEDPVELWNTSPFDPKVVDGKLFARGVSDNKANLLFRLQTIEQLLQEINDLPINIKWIIEGEEEIGSPHLHDLMKEHGAFWKDSNVCLWETGGINSVGAPVTSLGMKGVLYIELECEFNKGDLHSGTAAIVDSPVWRLVSALSTLRSVDGKVTLDGFYDNALPPTTGELNLLKESDFDGQTYADNLGTAKVLADVGNKVEFQKQMYFTGTANICGILGGYTKPGGIKTILPNKATAKIDFRLVPNQKAEDILQKLRAHLDARGFNDIKITKLVEEEYGKSKIENEYIQKCLHVLERVYGKKPEATVTNLGSGPIHYIAGVYDIPVVHIGASNPESCAHAPNENIRLSDYFMAMKAFKEFLLVL